MSARSHSRGYAIFYDGKDWRYKDNFAKLEDEERPCIRCGKYPTVKGHDACIGNHPNVIAACCGHGVSQPITMHLSSTG